MAVGGLVLAQLDVNRGVLEHARRVRIKQAVVGLIHLRGGCTAAGPECVFASGGRIKRRRRWSDLLR